MRLSPSYDGDASGTSRKSSRRDTPTVASSSRCHVRMFGQEAVHPTEHPRVRRVAVILQPDPIYGQNTVSFSAASFFHGRIIAAAVLGDSPQRQRAAAVGASWPQSDRRAQRQL